MHLWQNLRIIGICQTKIILLPRDNMSNHTIDNMNDSLHAGAQMRIDEHHSNLQISEHSRPDTKASHAPNINRGLLVVVEGLDRAGKDTLIGHLVALLKQAGEPVMVQAFPDRTTESGVTLDRFLRREIDLSDWECHELYAINRRELEEMLCETLMEGTTVICSRYAYSGVAYTAAKGHDMRKCMEADRGLLRPDLVVFLDVDADTVAVRNNFGKERYETQEFQLKVYSAFQTLWELLRNSPNRPKSENSCTDLLTISPADISEAPEKVLRAILKLKEEAKYLLSKDLFHLELNSS